MPLCVCIRLSPPQLSLLGSLDGPILTGNLESCHLCSIVVVTLIAIALHAKEGLTPETFVQQYKIIHWSPISVHTHRRVTLAVRPCSRQSCSSNLSFTMAVRGLDIDMITVTLLFHHYSGYSDSVCLTAPCPAGFPKSIWRGEQQTLLWHRSSLGYTGKHTQLDSNVLSNTPQTTMNTLYTSHGQMGAATPHRRQ